MPKLKHWTLATVCSGPQWIETEECHMAHDNPLFSSGLDNNPDLSELPNTHKIAKAASKYFYVWRFALFNNQVPPSPTATPLASFLSDSTMKLWERFWDVPLWSASRSVNNYSEPFFWLCRDFWVPFKKNKRLSLKQNKSALSLQITVLCMEAEQNYKTETEKSMGLILARF